MTGHPFFDYGQFRGCCLGAFRAVILDFRLRLGNRCRVEWFRLQLSLLQRGIARLQHRCEAQAGTGCHEGGIILSKKPPEWRPVPAASTACIRF